MISSPSDRFVPQHRRPQLYYGWVMLSLCLILVTITYGIRFSFSVFFQPLEESFVWTRAVTSTIFSLYMLLGAVFAVLGGWIADRHGPRIVLLIMGFLAAAGLAFSSRANSIWQLMFGYSFLVAAGNGATYPLAASIASRWFSERRTLALAISTSGVGLGSLLFPPFISFTIDGYGWRASFLILAAVSLVFTTPAALLLRRHPSEEAISSGKEMQPGSNSRSSIANGESLSAFSLRRAIRTQNFWVVGTVWFLYSFCLFTVATHLVRHGIDLGIDPLQAAGVISVMGAASIPGRIGAGILADRFSPKLVAVMCASFMAASMLWLTQSSNLLMLHAFAAVFGAAYSGLGPSTCAIVGDVFGVRHLGAILGALEVGWVSGAAVGPALAGYVFDIRESYSIAFYLALAAASLVILLLLSMRIPNPRRALNPTAFETLDEMRGHSGLDD